MMCLLCFILQRTVHSKNRLIIGDGEFFSLVRLNLFRVGDRFILVVAVESSEFVFFVLRLKIHNVGVCG